MEGPVEGLGKWPKDEALSGGLEKSLTPERGLQLQGAGLDDDPRARENDRGDTAIAPIDFLDVTARPGVVSDINEVVADAVLVEHPTGEATVAAPLGGVNGEPSFRHSW